MRCFEVLTHEVEIVVVIWSEHWLHALPEGYSFVYRKSHCPTCTAKTASQESASVQRMVNVEGI
jgi:hypothetical protein